MTPGPAVDVGMAGTMPCRGRRRGARTLTTLYDLIAGHQDTLGADDAVVLWRTTDVLRTQQATFLRVPQRVLWEVAPGPYPAVDAPLAEHAQVGREASQEKVAWYRPSAQEV